MQSMLPDALIPDLIRNLDVLVNTLTLIPLVPTFHLRHPTDYPA